VLDLYIYIGGYFLFSYSLVFSQIYFLVFYCIRLRSMLGRSAFSPSHAHTLDEKTRIEEFLTNQALTSIFEGTLLEKRELFYQKAAL
jgi:hypothetical protein